MGDSLIPASTSLAVEFLGAPGSGKSTLSRRLAEILAASGLRVTQPSYGLAHGIPHAARLGLKSRHVAARLIGHPFASAMDLTVLARTGQRTPRDLAKMAFNWLLVADLLSRRPRGEGIHIYDQGPFQALWSIGFGGARGAVARMAPRAAASGLMPEVMVILHASEETIVRRLAGRADRDSRLDAIGPGDRASLRRASELMDEVAGAMASLADKDGPPRVIPVDNDRDDLLEEVARRLAADIQFVFTQP